MAPTKNIQKQSCDPNRREFCKKIPCAALGIMASSGVLASFYKGSALPDDYLLKNENTMATTVTAKVISQKGSCGLGHKVGDEIIFTEDGVQGKICIHALYSFLPKVFAMMFDSQFPWLDDPDVSTSACPDAYNPVVFEISRKKESVRTD
jgi:uncharacterized repeat protein (TIGR04076 family)